MFSFQETYRMLTLSEEKRSDFFGGLSSRINKKIQENTSCLKKVNIKQ